MASLDSFPGPSGNADANEAGKDLAGLVVQSAPGVPRAGIFQGSVANLITGRADLKVDIGIFSSVLVRNNAARFSGNDASATVPASPLTAPVSNTKYAVYYQKQNETAAGDATNTSVIDVVQGAAFASLPTALADARALLPAGALELGHVALTAGATATNAMVITQTAPFTATAGGAVPFRTVSELNLWTTPVPNQYASVFADGGTGTNGLYVYRGGAWVQELGDTGWIAATLQSSWVNAGGSYQTARYRRKNGLVWGQAGRITSGIAGVNPVWTLPVGMRPSAFLVFAQWGNGGANGIEIGPDGRILPGDTGLTNLRQSIIFSFPADG